jgi:DNA-binding NarL/FixJ family response regulator
MPKTLVLVRDLMFASKISATAKAAAAEIEMLRDPQALSDKVGDRLIIDLNQPGTLEAAVAWKTIDPRRKVIGFVSHVDRQTIASAQSAGIDQIMPRSQFVAALETLLRT